MRLQVDVVGAFDDFMALRPEWGALYRATEQPTPFASHAFLAATWRTLERGRPLVAVARRDGRLVAALPLKVERREARFLTESSDVDAILAAGEPVETIGALVEALRPAFGYLRCFAIRDGALRAAAGASSALYPVGVQKIVDLPEGWDAFVASRSRTQRHQLRRRSRRLAEAGEIEYVHAAGHDELGAALEEAYRLHALRWQARHDGSNFAGEASRRFHAALLEHLEPEDGACVHLLAVGGRTIAFQITFTAGSWITAYRTGFDPEYARFGPGVVLMHEALRALTGERAMHVNFLRGDEAYKSDLATRERPLLGGTCLALGLRAVAGTLRHRAVDEAWLRLRRIEPAREAYHRLVARRNAARPASSR